MERYKVRFSVRIHGIAIAIVILCVLAHFAFWGIEKLTGVADSLLDIYKEYDSFAEEIVADVDEDTFYTSKETKIYFADGTLLTKLSNSDHYNYVYIDDVPIEVENAFISIEDKRFYLHKGVDWQSTVYAGILEVLTHGNSSRGGSTITQQLARNKFLTFEKSYERKLKEILIALKLEEKFTKKQILEFYINTINFSNNYYGINAASNGYFHKDISECTTAEVALLCAIPNNPSIYNPRTNLNNTIKRRDIILREMYANDFISKQEYLSSLEEEPVIYNSSSKDFYNYESSYAIFCTVEELMKYDGFDFRYSFKSNKDYKKYMKKYQKEYDKVLGILKTGGFTVKTSLNRDVQDSVQKAVDKQLKKYKKKQDNGVYLVQGAATVIDNASGYVIGIVGGRSQKGITDSNIITLNRAYQSYRQPGSTIKPLLVYTPALEQGMKPNDTVIDEYVEDGPHNAGNNYSGKITLRYAVEKSKNVVAWNLFRQIGVSTGMKKLEQMQYSKVLPSDYNLASVLGGFTKGVSTVEMAAGYATLANNGLYREPTCVINIIDCTNKILLQSREDIRVYDKVATEYMTDILMGVATDGTAAGLTIGHGIPIACKTGTTNNNVSAWFCGYSPYYTCAVYVGADDGSGTKGLYGATAPKNIWKQIEEDLCAGKKKISFNLKDIEKTEYEETDLDDAHIEDTHGNVYSDGNEDIVKTENISDPLVIQGETNKDDKQEIVDPIDIDGEIPEEEEPEEVVEDTEDTEEIDNSLDNSEETTDSESIETPEQGEAEESVIEGSEEVSDTTSDIPESGETDISNDTSVQDATEQTVDY